MRQGSRSHSVWVVGLGALMTFFLAVAGGNSVARAAQTHAFDPVLSLTGGCTTSPTDPIPDPPISECPAGAHPPASFAFPRSVTTDFSGDIYVTSYGNQKAEGKEGRIDIFDPKGFFITDVPDSAGPMATAVDSKGNIYVFEHIPGLSKFARLSPTLYNPAADEIAYEKPPVVIAENFLTARSGVAINPLNDHVFVHYASRIVEFSSAAEGNKVVDEFGKETLENAGEGASVAVDAAHGLVYVSDRKSFTEGLVRVFELAPPHKLLRTFDGSNTELGKFGVELAIAADEGTGHVFVYDGGNEGSKVVHEFTSGGELVSTISFGIKDTEYIKISIDNGPESPNGALNPDGRYLFVPSGPSGVGHALAYEPFNKCPAVVKSASIAEVAETSAEFRATINPCNDPTSYVFEYTTKQRYQEEEFAGAVTAGEGQIPAEGTEIEVAASALGLEPGTTYMFQVVASNELGSDEGEGEFATYSVVLPLEPCPNDDLRVWLSTLLPDCRAYELVTPANTNGRLPEGVDHLGIYFPAPQASPTGDKASFIIRGGLLSGSEGTGSFAGDPYLSTRTENGWQTAQAGPTGSEAVAMLPGSTSPDQGYSFWSVGGGGSAEIEGEETTYVRYPDGHSELVGRGSLGVDPRARGKLISGGGSHIIFVTGNSVGEHAVQLEEDAPPDGTVAIYDRTPDEVTHVVSLLPGNVTPLANQTAEYMGASLDGKGVAFKIDKRLYLRFNDEQTYEIGENVTFAGVAEGGVRIFYLKSGDLFAFDAEREETIRFTESGDITPVNVAAEGSAAYFVSPSVLTAEANPNGAKAAAGKENLYLSREGAISFVGIVTGRDVAGEGGNEVVDGLGLWTDAVYVGRLGEDPSRSTPEGNVLLFESRAALTDYNPEGHAEVYRYDFGNDELDCLSCIPTRIPADGSASLESVSQGGGDPEPFSSYALVNNLRADGRRALFQSTEALVPGDTDGLLDVYEWEDQGVGTCERTGGCTYLISSGHSIRPEYLYAVSDSGNDALFRSSDLLVAADHDETPSIYDARVNGGFPEPEGDPCQVTQLCPAPTLPAPSFSTPGSRNTGPPGNVSQKCPKGKRAVRLHGKVRCGRKHHKRHHHKAGSKGKGAGK
jgi:hypothetical protein